MKEIVRTNDPVLVNFIGVLLSDAGIETLVADQNMSLMEGSIGAFPRRIMVRTQDHARAVSILKDADLGAWLVEGDGT
ncbi:MAG: DUF2007 domain-containing protein [Hyphomicrobiaceae bacterium]